MSETHALKLGWELQESEGQLSLSLASIIALVLTILMAWCLSSKGSH